jgi:hypothetical protein
MRSKMKTLLTYLKNDKFILRFKYFVVFPALFMMLCSFDNGCGDEGTPSGCSGVSTPPPPVFNISYAQGDNGKGKFYFTSNERIVLQSINVVQDSIYVVETINFEYPYLVCEAGDNHIINEYSEVQAGQKWTFTFTGMSKSTGYSFSTLASVLTGSFVN